MAEMKSIIGIYHSHEKAIEAVRLLQGDGFPETGISLMGKTNVHHNDLKTTGDNLLTEGPVTAGLILGPILGVLTGIGIFAIPGLGFLYGAGALVGALAGLDFGLVGGGVLSLLTTIGVSELHHVKLEEHLKKGKVILVAKGNQKQINRAKEILVDFNQHDELIHQ